MVYGVLIHVLGRDFGMSYVILLCLTQPRNFNVYLGQNEKSSGFAFN